jgi:hypothetical protein
MGRGAYDTTRNLFCTTPTADMFAFLYAEKMGVASLEHHTICSKGLRSDTMSCTRVVIVFRRLHAQSIQRVMSCEAEQTLQKSRCLASPAHVEGVQKAQIFSRDKVLTGFRDVHASGYDLGIFARS